MGIAMSPIDASSGIVASVTTILGLAFLGSCLWSHLTSPLCTYPGPFIARWTNIWRLVVVWRGDYHLTIRKLHDKYGRIVRIGPNIIDIDYPDMIKTIYSIKGDWTKTEFYHVSSAFVAGKIVHNLFSDTDNKRQGQKKRPVAKFYSMNSVMLLEPHIDRMIDQLCGELDVRFVDQRKTCDIGQWMVYYMWDVIGAITYSRPYGFLEHGSDFNGILKAAEKFLDYFAVVGQIPALDHWLDKNPIRPIGPPSARPLVDIAVKRFVDRCQGIDKAIHNPDQPDYLDKFIEAKANHPDIVDDAQIVIYLLINTVAGADTTAITLKAVLYFVLKHPDVWQRLTGEIREPSIRGAPVGFREARSMPFLEAVIRESMRMHPGVLMPLERYVPRGGARLPDGREIPAGTIVGINPYINARNRDLWGDDVDSFRPERWLQGENELESDYRDRLACMNNSDLTFGAGNRMCLGQQLATMQLYKVIATLVEKYDISLVDAQQNWRLTNSWFTRQEGGLDAKLVRRH